MRGWPPWQAETVIAGIGVDIVEIEWLKVSLLRTSRSKRGEPANRAL
jgi:hypothetical protein